MYTGRTHTIKQNIQGDQYEDSLRTRVISVLMRQYFDSDFDTIQAQYTQFVHKLVAAGGYAWIVEGRSPVAE